MKWQAERTKIFLTPFPSSVSCLQDFEELMVALELDSLVLNTC
jgi:hypothetical protein